MDEVAERSTALVEQLWARVLKQESWEADEWEHDAMFVDFEVLFALDAAGVFNGFALGQLEDVDGAFARWLEGWDGYFDGLDPQGDFKQERRQTHSTFRLVSLGPSMLLAWTQTASRPGIASRMRRLPRMWSTLLTRDARAWTPTSATASGTITFDPYDGSNKLPDLGLPLGRDNHRRA